MKPIIVKELSKWLYDLLVKLWTESDLPFKPKGRDSFENLSNRLESTSTWLIVLVEDDVDIFDMDSCTSLVGAVIVTHDGQRGWINRLAVHPDYRGNGYARLLIEKSENLLRDEKVYLFAALIEKENIPSLSLFGSAGYITHETIVYLSKRDYPEY